MTNKNNQNTHLNDIIKEVTKNLDNTKRNNELYFYEGKKNKLN